MDFAAKTNREKRIGNVIGRSAGVAPRERARDLSGEEALRQRYQAAGNGAASITSRSAVSLLPLVSGPRSTAITTMTRKSIVLIIIGRAKPMFICTAR